jgi:acyl carrier protein
MCLKIRSEVAVHQLIRDVLATHGKLGVDAHVVADHADLYELGLTSHAAVSVMLGLEDEFGIEFPDSEMRKSTFESIASIADAVNKLSGAAA